MRCFALVFAMASSALASSAHPAILDELGPKDRKDAECLEQVLHETPGVDRIEWESIRSAGWTGPYLQFRAIADETGYRQIVHYITQPPCPVDPSKPRVNCCINAGFDHCFMTFLSGITTSARPANDWGTVEIEKRWAKRCGVHAWGLFI